MFVVMNRIPVNPDYADLFEERFRSRAGEVDKMPGFIRNQVLRPARPEQPYIVLTYWQSRQDFEAWVDSDAFKKGHSRSGALPQEAFKGPAALESFEVILDSATQ
ncbi:MAG TPA: antibiotic biosynthesis monooxygenase [Nitrospiria bacterium]|nr:antibiotic biosynthesis monooxygenase [Nitrospiria bacterium]